MLFLKACSSIGTGTQPPYSYLINSFNIHTLSLININKWEGHSLIIAFSVVKGTGFLNCTLCVCVLEMRLQRLGQSVLRRLVCGWRCTVMPFWMTATWSMWAGPCMIRCVCVCVPLNYIVIYLLWRHCQRPFLSLSLCLSSRGRCGWSVLLLCRVCIITESWTPDWNSSPVALRWCFHWDKCDCNTTSVHKPHNYRWDKERSFLLKWALRRRKGS